MKTIDFSFAGGFPLTQRELDHLQRAYTESITALGAPGAAGLVPAALTGIEVSSPGGASLSATDGWLLYNGEVIPFYGSTATPTGTDVVLVQISTLTTNLIYNDGLSHPALAEKEARLITGPTATTASVFPLLSVQPYQYWFGLNGRDSSWHSLSVSTSSALGSVSGTIDYKLNWLNNTVHLKGALSANAAQNFSASPGALYYLMTSLPANCRPNTNVYFTGYYYASNLFKDDLGIGWIKQVTCVCNVAGQIQVNFLRPDAAITGYSVSFNTIIPLD